MEMLLHLLSNFYSLIKINGSFFRTPEAGFSTRSQNVLDFYIYEIVWSEFKQNVKKEKKEKAQPLWVALGQKDAIFTECVPCKT